MNKRRRLNLVLRGWSGTGETWHIVAHYAALPADPDDEGYWAATSPAACGREVRVRMAPDASSSQAREAAERLGYVPVVTWRRDDLEKTCRQCLERLDPDLRVLLGLNEPKPQLRAIRK